jgi:hypothetical protein
MQLAKIWGNPREAFPCSYHPKFGLSTVVRCLSQPSGRVPEDLILRETAAAEETLGICRLTYNFLDMILTIYWTYHSPARKGTLPPSNWKATSPTSAQAEVWPAVDVVTTFRHETSPRPKEQAEKTMRRIVQGLFGLSDGGSEL